MPFTPLRRALIALASAVALTASGAVATTAAQAATCATSQLNVVAHPDDDLFFQNPVVQAAVASGGCVTTAYLTAGDAGDGAAYWSGREDGVKAAYAQMAGVANAWTASTVSLAGKRVASAVLTAKPAVRVVFFRLPDGGLTGAGFPATGSSSLKSLEEGDQSTITAVDRSADYTPAALQDSMQALLDLAQPTAVNTLDFVGGYGDGDHADHHAVGYLTKAAVDRWSGSPALVGWEGYNTQNRAENLTSAQLTAKAGAFYAYAPYDTKICSTATACAGRPEAAWLRRSYPVTPAVSSDPKAGNLARTASVTASSQNSADGQTASAAIDGVVDGYPGDYRKEWATTGQGAGATISLTWAKAQRIGRVVLYDRTNPSDRITSGRLTFSDGSTVPVPALSDDGTGTAVTFDPRTVTGVQLTVLTVSATTSNVGLAELEVYAPTETTGAPVPANVAGAADVTASSQNTADGQTAVKAVDGFPVGYPADATREWATVGGGAGSWLQLTWGSARALTRVVLHDRPNTDDQVTSGRLLFSDGSSLPVGALANDGTATTVDFASKSTTSLRFAIDGVSTSTRNVGLSELQAWTGTAGGTVTPYPSTTPTPAPTAAATPAPTPVVTATPTPTPVVTPTPTPTATPTPTPTPTPTATPTPTPTAAPTPIPTLPAGTNIAGRATLTATSTVAGSPALAVDGNLRTEWVTQRSGSALRLAWPSAQRISSFAIADRPAADQQITSGMIVFSNGSIVRVPALKNDGAPTVVTFPAVSTTSATFYVLSVSATTKNAGLAEIAAYTP